MSFVATSLTLEWNVNVAAASGEVRPGRDSGERTGVPGEQAHEEDRETGGRDALQADHTGTGNLHTAAWFASSLGITSHTCMTLL